MIAASTLPHVGTLLIDIDRPREIRWVGTSISPGRNHMSPFFLPGEAALFYYGGGDMQGPSVSDLGDEARCSYLRWELCSTVNNMVVVQRGVPEVELDRFEDGFFPDWSPVADKVAFCQDGMIKEYTVGGGVTDVPGTAGDVRWPTYSPDGTDIAYMSGGASNWHIRLTSGASVPTATGADDSRPIWSPDGSAIIFIRTYDTGSEFVLWNVGDPAVVELTDLPDGTILAGAEVDNECRDFRSWPTRTSPPFSTYSQDRSCFFGNPVWGEVPQ